ncbi:hypothetical protein ACX818_001421 [Acinetobacter baumannii]
MATIIRGCTVYHLETHKSLVKKLGGIKAIESKVKTPLLRGEQLYLEIILDVANKFKEQHNADFS